MSHGMGTDSHTRQGGHGACGPTQVLQQNVSSAVSAQSVSPAVLQERLLFVGVDALRRTETAGRAAPTAAAMGRDVPDVLYRGHRQMAVGPDESRAASDQAILEYGRRCHR